MNNELMFSSANQAWSTPKEFFDKLNAQHKFQIDLCAEKKTAKCDVYFTKEDDLFKQTIFERTKHTGKITSAFMNPPYGREMPRFIKWASENTENNVKTVALIPSRTDTKMFHKYIWNKDLNKPRDGVGVIFLEGRLTFGTDEYWEWVWEQESLNGKKNSLYKKYGKRNSAPFPSMIVIFNPSTEQGKLTDK